MSGLETAIRQALERSDRTSPEMRARIYQSARNALEAGLRKQDVHDAEVIAQQRHRLEVLIHAIENEERANLKMQVSTEVTVEAPAAKTSPAEDSAPPIDDSLDIAPGRHDGMVAANRNEASFGDLRADRRSTARSTDAPVSAEPQLGADEIVARSPQADPALHKEKRGQAAGVQEPPRKRRRRSRLLSFLMVLTVLVAAFGTAGWWVVSSGLLQTAAERDTSVANPPARVSSEDFSGAPGLPTLGTQSGFTSDWIDVYKPGDGEAPTTGPQASADLVSDEAGQHLRIISSNVDAGGDVHIQIPATILEQLSGKTSTLALTVQADMGKTTQFSVECDFSTLGECGRHRFTLNDEKIDMLFKVTFDRSLAPKEPGSIVISSDVTGSGASLNLFAVRILPGQ
ncbi:hypothetical protein QO002_000974 [Pararhizobium capsulatum DSM 1112]|uniref:Biotin transporter BioY n=1 Tax=Pararhizobium capsulatum DSM 1112 TaxID=1121113 RepID=A0ABU0BKR1_9HYPH|nr:biotin transporter BioY [Pararhizobium capsulatum]MDQ0318836.1 hypothetical protein [Pararhizobium capsulatum DSM 1112]